MYIYIYQFLALFIPFQESFDLEKCLDRLKLSIASCNPPLKLAQTRLKKRMRRPDVELCNDEPHQHLTMEVKELQESIRMLENKLEEGNKALAEMLKNRERLEQNIKVKKNSLLIDQQKCMTMRRHFPFIVVCTNKDPPTL